MPKNANELATDIDAYIMSVGKGSPSKLPSHLKGRISAEMQARLFTKQSAIDRILVIKRPGPLRSPRVTTSP